MCPPEDIHVYGHVDVYEGGHMCPPLQCYSYYTGI